MKRKDFNLYTHVWVLDDFEGNARIVEDYKQYKNVIFVEFLSNEYLKYLASAKYLINNVTFPPYFTKKKEQVYLNTWHGIPLKTLGYDQVNGSVEVANTIRNFLCADYLLSPCSYQTEIYKKAFKLEGIYEGKIIEEGQPRNDLSLDVYKRQGWFKYVRGFVFGRPCMFRSFLGYTYEEAVLSVLEEYNVPVIFDADIGHKGPQFTIVNGALATVTCQDGRGTYQIQSWD